MKKKVIGFVHTHWDREWYREFEVFRLRLLRVFDNVLDMLENNLLPSFYFDGQTSALEDYLEMRPEKKELVIRMIKEQKLFIGPFYCLIDEFLTSYDVFSKNLEFGQKYAKEMGCNQFLGYFADTFGHTPNLIPILKKYGINTAIVWRGCGEIPAEFTWCKNNDEKIKCINLVRGYFNDFFTADIYIEKRVELIKDNLDKIAKYSGDVLLMPIGGDHLGVNKNLMDLISDVNKRLDDYEIEIGSIFDYIELVKHRFSQYEHYGELRDNSKTFTLQGSFSSRMDLKTYNVITTHILQKADKLRCYFEDGTIDKYENPICYAYKLLLQNQAHDSIYGCSLDDVHQEDIIRYKKIQQIANTIIDEIRFEKNINDDEVFNLDNYDGVFEFKSYKKYDGYQVIDTQMGFEKSLLTNTLRVPITEDYKEIYTYLGYVKGNRVHNITEESDVFVTDDAIGNSKIFLSVKNGIIYVGNYELSFVDYIDNGDSYNEGVKEDDIGRYGKIVSSKKLYQGIIRSALELKVDVGEILNVIVELDNQSELLNFKIDWENCHTNHNLKVVLKTPNKIYKTYSEDTDIIIEREFDPDYNIRENLPKIRGVEVKNNTAPMQRGVWTNGVGIVTCGLCQYEINAENIEIPILRSTEVLSNPKNPARTTPAGPPLPLYDLQQLGANSVRFYIFIGNENQLKLNINRVYNLTV